MRTKRLLAAFALAAAIAVATPKPAEAVAWYCFGCKVFDSYYQASLDWWDSVNPFPLW